MKKSIYGLFTFAILIFLSACGSSADMTEYVDVSFSGVDTMGTADYDVKKDKLLKDVFDYDEDTDFADEETEEEMDNLEDAYKINLDKDKQLSNGDTVKLSISVNDDKTDKIEGGEKEVTVEGLEKPDVLTSDDVEENLVLNFTGASGKGEAEIENTFDDSRLSNLNFEVKNNGELANDDQAEIKISDESQKTLNNAGYILDDDFNPTFKVEDLYNVAEKAEDIKNLDDIKRMIDEKAGDEYEDKDAISITYDYEQEAIMYRQFDEQEDEKKDTVFGSNAPEDNNGNLIKIYSVEKHDKFGDDKEFIATIGFSNIEVNKNGKANVSEMEDINVKNKDSYSFKSVIQLYEGEGYTKLKDD